MGRELSGKGHARVRRYPRRRYGRFVYGHYIGAIDSDNVSDARVRVDWSLFLFDEAYLWGRAPGCPRGRWNEDGSQGLPKEPGNDQG